MASCSAFSQVKRLGSTANTWTFEFRRAAWEQERLFWTRKQGQIIPRCIYLLC